jgi:hypothetical protein
MTSCVQVSQQVQQQIGSEHQHRQPGLESEMGTKPVYILDNYKVTGGTGWCAPESDARLP